MQNFKLFRSVRECLYSIGIGKDFLNVIQNYYQQKQKEKTLKSLKLFKTFCASRGTAKIWAIKTAKIWAINLENKYVAYDM